MESTILKESFNDRRNKHEKLEMKINDEKKNFLILVH